MTSQLHAINSASRLFSPELYLVGLKMRKEMIRGENLKESEKKKGTSFCIDVSKLVNLMSPNMSNLP